MKRSLLVIDSAFPYKVIKERSLEDLVMGRDLNEYFDNVYSCNPVGSILEALDSTERYGKTVTFRLSPRHSITEGFVGRFPWLSSLSILNFIFAQVAFLRELVYLVKTHNIQVIRSEDPLYNGFLGLVVSKICKLPLMIGVWGNPGEVRKNTGKPLMRRLFKWIWVEELVETFVLRRADAVLVQNYDNKEFVVSKGVLRDKIHIFRFGNLLHPNHFADPKARKLNIRYLQKIAPNNEKIILVVSRLEKLKLVHHTILALKHVTDRVEKPVLLIVGDGRDRLELEQLAKKLDLSTQVIFCGNKNQVWLSNIIPLVSIFVAPLTGRALGEASLGRAPVVAYNIDWHSEIIINNETGLLVPFLDYKALAIAIEELLLDTIKARAFGNALRKKALSMLDPKKADEMQRRVYETFFLDRNSN